MTNRKNRLLSVLLMAFVMAAQWAGAQKTYFVYIQSDNQQQFYVSLNGKNTASTSLGYVILPKLHDSTYAIKVGFPGGAPAAQEFDLVVNGNDMGYLLKDFGEKGYGLFNLQSLAVVMNSNEANKKKALEQILLAEQKRKADSLAVVQAAIEKQKQDSISKAEALIAQQRVQDSVRAEEKRKLDSATAVAAKAAEEAKKQAETATAPVAKEPVAESKTIVKETGTSEAAPVAAKDSVIFNQPVIEKRDSVIFNPPVIVKKDSIVFTPPVIVKTDSAVVKPVDAIAVKTADQTTAVIEKKQEPKKDSIVEEPVLYAKDSVIEKPVTIDTAVRKADTSIPPVASKPATEKSPRFLDIEIQADSTAAKDTATAVKPIAPSAVIVAKQDTVKPVQAIVAPVAAPEEKKPDTTETKATITSNNVYTTVVAEKASEKSNAVVPSNNCKRIASEKDFLALRKKMIGGGDAGAKILEAKSVFKEKCFTNEQLRNLCVLLLDDASRLRFLDEAYPYTTDPQTYKQLASVLTDDFYIRRFNAIVK